RDRPGHRKRSGPPHRVGAPSLRPVASRDASATPVERRTCRSKEGSMSERSSLGPFTRRSFLTGLGGAAIALSAPAGPAPSAQPASVIKRGGTFVESINWTYPNLDSHLSSQPFMAGYEAMYNTLVRFEVADAKTGEQKVVGDLAESWEQPDPKTMLFKLRQGVTFHDGS